MRLKHDSTSPQDGTMSLWMTPVFQWFLTFIVQVPTETL